METPGHCFYNIVIVEVPNVDFIMPSFHNREQHTNTLWVYSITAHWLIQLDNKQVASSVALSCL